MIININLSSGTHLLKWHKEVLPGEKRFCANHPIKIYVNVKT